MKTFSLLLGIVVIALLIFSLNSSTTSQNDLSNLYEDNNYKEGELIVMFKSNINAGSFANNYQNLDLRIKEVLVKDMNIYLLEYDATKSGAVDALVSVMRSNDVAVAQFNHFVKERSLIQPNDTRFNEQWDKHNTGQSGGTPDADIDAPEAWDIATGGVTALGDTIVLAIVDGGQQVNHPDLNTWRNWAEIPGNNIDDDNNGYIDDINGWNAISNNGTILSDQHGTHCAGIAGARGNNNQGVAGVNWNVKTMPIVGSSGTESIVIKAYGYVLKQRKIYNQTNGSQGAFVVATNSSFGVDFGQPSNFPLWCAFYDSLGAAGILSAGAGPNQNVNIDVVGDIPTACPSNFMIAVTNTTRTDAKSSGAGYGPINMDLGAPGTDILSTYPTNTYGLSTGTSMATPQVTGAVGLMYGGASTLFIQLARNDPDSAALLFKQFILSTVDTIPSLSAITLSKGRLNLHKMIQKVRITNVPVLNAFSLRTPNPNATIISLPLSSTQHTFTWDTSATGATYRFVFGNPTTSPRKISIATALNSLILTSGQLDNLLAGFGLNQGDSLVGQWDVWTYRLLPVNDSLKSVNGPRAITLKRGIPSLTSFSLLSPANNTTIETTPTDFSNFKSTWSKSGQGVKFKWIFAVPNFNTPANVKAIYQSDNGGFDTSLTIRKSRLDSLAASLGVGNNDSILGQWRVYGYSLNDSAASSQTYNLRLRRLPITTITIGAGTADDQYPLNRSNNYFRWQGMYLGSEINTSGTIRKIKFYQNNSVAAITSENLRIFMKTSTEQVLPTGTWDTLGMTMVFSGSMTSLAAPGWSEINLTTPFIFNHSQNLIIGIGRDFQQSITIYPRYAYTSTSPNYRTRRGQSNTLYPANLTQSFNRANIQLDISLITGLDNNFSSIPDTYSLAQNFPNPFNPVTKINFAIPKQGLVTLKIYDILGKEVVTLMNEHKAAGFYNIEFNAGDFASGVYFYRLEASEFIDVKRMMLIK